MQSFLVLSSLPISFFLSLVHTRIQVVSVKVSLEIWTFFAEFCTFNWSSCEQHVSNYSQMIYSMHFTPSFDIKYGYIIYLCNYNSHKMNTELFMRYGGNMIFSHHQPVTKTTVAMFVEKKYRSVLFCCNSESITFMYFACNSRQSRIPLYWYIELIDSHRQNVKMYVLHIDCINNQWENMEIIVK